MTAPLLAVRDLRVHYGGRRGLFGKSLVVRAVDGVSFDLIEGETLGVVGESGCGKSTLGRAIVRLVPATAGAIEWQGRDLLAIDGPDLRRERRHLQFIFQDPLASLDPRMTVARILERPLLAFRPELTAARRRDRIRELLGLVGMRPDAVGRYPHEFSGGQCQRIGIARALAAEPKLILCDEPVSALDVSIQSQILALLVDLQQRLGLSLIFISHNLAVVRRVSRRVLVMYLGRIVEIAERDAFFARPLHPYSQALIAAVPIPDPRRARARRRLILQGDLPSPIDPPSGCRFRTRCPKATDLCARVEPPLIDHGGSHLAACHFPG